MIDFASSMLSWYNQYKRDLPWRHTSNPYFIWVSEMMLQQTRVETVIPYYLRFINQIPTISDLAQIPEDDLLKLWQGLGYYNRAKNMKKAANQIVLMHQGKFPRSYNEVVALTGIGPYSAGAILSIAYDIKVPAVDGNVLRIMTRYMMIEKDITKKETIKEVTDVVLDFMPKDHIGDFNQALMELGATVCLPNGAPLCGRCPLKLNCQALLNHKIDALPIKPVKRERKIEQRTIFKLVHEGKIAIKKRKSTGLLSNMYELINIDRYMSEADVYDYINIQKWKVNHVHSQRQYRHIFTHITWDMIGYTIELDKKPEDISIEWIYPHELKEKYALPQAFMWYIDF